MKLAPTQKEKKEKSDEHMDVDLQHVEKRRDSATSDRRPSLRPLEPRKGSIREIPDGERPQLEKLTKTELEVQEPVHVQSLSSREASPVPKKDKSPQPAERRSVSKPKPDSKEPSPAPTKWTSQKEVVTRTQHCMAF